jgi:hypothetical protein
MPHKLNSGIAVIGIDIGKNSFHVVGHDKRGAIMLRQRGSICCTVGALSSAHELRVSRICRGWRPNELWGKYSRPIPPSRRDRATEAAHPNIAMEFCWTHLRFGFG